MYEDMSVEHKCEAALMGCVVYTLNSSLPVAGFGLPHLFALDSQVLPARILTMAWVTMHQRCLRGFDTPTDATDTQGKMHRIGTWMKLVCCRWSEMERAAHDLWMKKLVELAHTYFGVAQPDGDNVRLPTAQVAGGMVYDELDSSDDDNEDAIVALPAAPPVTTMVATTAGAAAAACTAAAGPPAVLVPSRVVVPSRVGVPSRVVPSSAARAPPMCQSDQTTFNTMQNMVPPRQVVSKKAQSKRKAPAQFAPPRAAANPEEPRLSMQSVREMDGLDLDDVGFEAVGYVACISLPTHAWNKTEPRHAC